MMAKTKVTYIISNIDKAIAFEWITDAIDKTRFELSFILLNAKPSYLCRHLSEKGIEVHELPFTGKKDMPGAVLKCLKLLNRIRPDAVHCHLFEADLIGLTAARLAGIKKRIYTRHHSTFHLDYFPKAVKWDRYINRMSTHIVAISQTVKNILVEREQVAPSKITTIYHGFDISSFASPDPAAVQALREAYNPSGKFPVVGVISRFVEIKGVQDIVPAFGELLKTYPDALLLLFNAKGNYTDHIKSLLKDLPAGTYREVEFEYRITSLYHIFDLFLHVPINSNIEAFGQTYIEAFAARVPLIATRSGIGNEILRDRENSLVVPYRDYEAIHRAMLEMLQNPALKNTFINNGFSTIQSDFTIEKMVQQLENLYLR